MNKAELENLLRTEYFDFIANALQERGEEILHTGPGEIAIPVVDTEQNEKFIVIKISVPRGSRIDGTYCPYNGYDIADDYTAKLQQDAVKKEEREEKKKKKEEEAERRRQEKLEARRLKELASSET